MLLLLWRQFDVLVGQIKHITIHGSEKWKNKAKKGFRSQKARNRVFNKQNRDTFQQNSKSQAAALHESPVPLQANIPTITGHLTTTSPQQYVDNPYVLLTSYPQVYHAPTNVTPVNCMQNQLPNVKDAFLPQWKTPTKTVVQTGCTDVTRSNVISESIQEINSSENVQPGFEQILPCDSFKSPKRKSVPPKKRTVEGVCSLPPAHVSLKTNTVTSTETIAQDDSQRDDIQSFVDKILGQPELSQKLAENINRAVGIDASAEPQPISNAEILANAQTQSAVVDRNKVDDIMEMMKLDPVFEDLFSSFENFESSCEESHVVETKDQGSKDTQDSTSSNNTKDNEALDGLLLLACSPMVHLGQSPDSLETPPKVNASASLSSPVLASTRSVPVVLSPGNTSPSKRHSQPIVSHIRRLNFKTVDNDHTAGIIVSASMSESNKKVNKMENEVTEEVISKEGRIVEVKNMSEEVCVEQMETTMGDNSRIDLEKKKENSEVCNVENGQVKRNRNNPVVFQCEKEKSETSSEATECVNSDNMGSEDVAFCSERGDKTNTENCPEETRSFRDSPLKLQVLEEAATNELLECQSKTVQPAESTKKTPVKSSPPEPVGQKSSVIDVDADRSLDVLPCRAFKTDVSETLTSLIKAEVSCVAECVKIKTAENIKSSGNDLTLSTDSEKNGKRKLKKKKKSSRTSKKAKVIPEDLDVDKFLSQLHYVQAGKT
ncbi:suppressor of mar1-1 protein-like isoform X2 [Dendronephthya gigantea]|nr:suppressor of mar1-1 protein-like isoform X2 [Dendronephthya gigantea]